MTDLTRHHLDLNQPFVVTWLSEIELPLANKFYRKFRFSGRARRHEFCAVVKNQENTVVGCGYLREHQSFNLLSGVAVSPIYQRQGVASLLLSKLSEHFGQHTYTFPFLPLVKLYQTYGFQLVDSKIQPHQVRNLYHRYLNQGRAIEIMSYVGNTCRKQS